MLNNPELPPVANQAQKQFRPSDEAHNIGNKRRSNNPSN